MTKGKALLTAVLVAGITASCATTSSNKTQITTFVLATTTSTQDSGLLDVLTAEFEKSQPSFRAKVVAVGSGEALDLGRRGDADVLLVHSPDQEKKFMSQGFGVYRKAVMRNDFVIVGPKPDPADIKASKSAADAFSQIFHSHSSFVSRGDGSGTNTKEMKTWAAAHLDPSKSDWYLQTGQGMADTLMVSSEKNAYTITDTATFTVMQDKLILVKLFSNDSKLVNQYHVITAKKARRPAAGFAFAKWITGPKGQAFLAQYGQNIYGRSLFVPNAGKTD